MDFPTHFSTFFTISMLIFLSSSSSTNAASKLVNSICSQTGDYASKCQQLIGSDRKTKDLEDPKKLAEIVLQMSLEDAQKSYDFINQMLKEKATEPVERCVFWYEAVVASFKSAHAELEEDPESANYDVKIAGDYADNCENGLANGSPIPEISAKNDQVWLSSRIGFAVTNLL
ncbi:hypothetical protein FEM48_Zijuj06G0188000 [Ziziphus jujuba var. spinosa]|uniref:Pectinesterase inhibitor domain-containing protein n=1 Tax=Ziziphus jujuba var. spinosa TaxID=714518 RepID=A0A978VB04_ZIZJJ|nr:hypothetical protein FEM48_Zijuj06G0188000 [Ziziphus jujuba var. spinosa]